MAVPIARAIAFYLPQFHPVHENNVWWGEGFTEWTNTAKATSLFRGHYQPHIPANLGFYDLRVPETRVQQAFMAKEFGIEAFCYYHYWFAGKQLLQRPFEEVLSSAAPDFPFCLCWANETWSGIWHGEPKRVLIEQTYPGPIDHQAHFEALLPAFKDVRYVCVDGKPIFLIYKPLQITESKATLNMWRKMAQKTGLSGLHLVAVSNDIAIDFQSLGYDASVLVPRIAQHWVSRRNLLAYIRHRVNKIRNFPDIVDFETVSGKPIPENPTGIDVYPAVIHAWDNTPRSKKNGVAYVNSTPDLYRKALNLAVRSVSDKPFDHRLIFLKSWNEWAEGNHLEPDLKYGKSYLKVVRDVLHSTQN